MFTRMPTKIEWTDDTWNPWWGCDKIAHECDHCYAADFALAESFTAPMLGLRPRENGQVAITRASPSVWQAPVTVTSRATRFHLLDVRFFGTSASRWNGWMKPWT